MSATIEKDYRLVDKYLEHGQITGSLMCAIALLSWYMTLGKEILDGASLPHMRRPFHRSQRATRGFSAQIRSHELKRLLRLMD